MSDTDIIISILIALAGGFYHRLFVADVPYGGTDGGTCTGEG